MKVPATERMMAIARMVESAKTVSDIGCDHAYTSIYLIEAGIAKHVIAMDINQGPLGVAKKNIEQYGYTDQIETRLSNGAQKLSPGEADTLLISGMGGELICRILAAASDVVKGIRQLVLQPQSEIHLVRHFLHEHGFQIDEENMLQEDGKYYVIMRAVPGEEIYSEEFEYIYGRCLLQNQHLVLRDYLDKEIRIQQKILQTLENLDIVRANTKERMNQVTQEIDMLVRLKGDYYNE